MESYLRGKIAMTYRCGQIIPIYAYSNEYGTNKNLGGDDQVTAPYAFDWMQFPTDLNATDTIHFRGSFDNSGNDWGLKIWFASSGAYGTADQTETFSVPTNSNDDYPVVEGEITPNADLITAAGNGEAIRVYVSGSQTAAASGYHVHGMTFLLERRA